MHPRDGDDLGDVHQGERWVRRGFDPDQLKSQRYVPSARILSRCTRHSPIYLGVLLDVIHDLILRRMFQVHERRLQALIRTRHSGHVPEGTAVHDVHADDVRVGTQALQQCRGRSGP